MINGAGQLMASCHQVPQAALPTGRRDLFFNILPAVIFLIPAGGQVVTSERK